jgi:hypothetical protein
VPAIAIVPDDCPSDVHLALMPRSSASHPNIVSTPSDVVVLMAFPVPWLSLQLMVGSPDTVMLDAEATAVAVVTLSTSGVTAPADAAELQSANRATPIAAMCLPEFILISRRSLAEVPVLNLPPGDLLGKNA